jgi:malonate transporter
MFVPALALARGGLDRRTILGFGSAYSNTVLLGIPLVVAALGPAASVPLFLLISFHSSIFFTLVTALIELGRGAGQSLARLPLRLVKALATNVILLSVLGGIAGNLAGLELPSALDQFADYLGRAAFPAALFAMGAALRRYRVGGAMGPALFMVAAKLVLHPLVVALLVLVLVDVPALHAQVGILCAALPVGINVYLFAVRYQVGEAESATAILLSNIFSVVTIAIVLLQLGPNAGPAAP